jgi:predicted anti-sigma-YlaC factor YlaD
MKCIDVKSNLPVYSDDILTVSERAELDAHLDTCPLCRQALSEYQTIKSGLRSLARPVMSADLLSSLRSNVTAHLRPPMPTPVFQVIEDRRGWLEAWLMPSAVGTLASIVFGTFLLWAIVSTARDPLEFASIGPQTRSGKIILASSNPMIGTDALDISPSEYATTRLSIASESPSINPQGALVALTRSLVRGEMKDEEVVVVADVFGNGLARIAEVVEPAQDSRAIEELERALESDPLYAPFVPASFDRRSERMRVVLKFQNVNVRMNSPTANHPAAERSRS